MIRQSRCLSHQSGLGSFSNERVSANRAIMFGIGHEVLSSLSSFSLSCSIMYVQATPLDASLPKGVRESFGVRCLGPFFQRDEGVGRVSLERERAWADRTQTKGAMRPRDPATWSTQNWKPLCLSARVSGTVVIGNQSTQRKV